MNPVGAVKKQQEPISGFLLFFAFYAVPPTLFYKIYTRKPEMHRVGVIVMTVS
jgi:hypothetical protein